MRRMATAFETKSLVWATGIWLLSAAGVWAGPTGFGFVGKSTSDSLAVFDLSTGTSALPMDMSLLPEGNYPYDATLKPDGSELWLVGAVGDGAIVIDAATYAEITRVSLASGTTFPGEYPVDVVFDSCRDRAYVASRDTDGIVILEASSYTPIGFAQTFITTGPRGAGKMALDPRTGDVYAVEWAGDYLFFFDRDTEEVSREELGGTLWDLAFDPVRETLYILDRGPDEVVVFHVPTRTVKSRVAVGADPWGVDLTADGSRLVVASEDSGTVSIVDTATLMVSTVTLPLDSDPRDVDLSTDGSRAYVVSGDVPNDDAVYVIDVAAASLIDTFPMGTGNPNVIAVAPDPLTLCPFFTDGFESGDTTAWSVTIP